jgi:two-component system sensor histidine kinase HydH
MSSAHFEEVGDGESVRQRAAELLHEQQQAVYQRTDRWLAYLMITQWVVSIGVAWFISPRTWAGKSSAIHMHVQAALLLGGAITSVPVLLAFVRPGWRVTRHVIAGAQMLWAALLIHLTGGRIETHFLVFGSLAFLGMYRDWKVFVPATVVIAIDHLLRQIYWPESVFGIIAPEWWRWLEHAFYVVFEDAFLIASCVSATEEMTVLSRRQAELEDAQQREQDKSMALDRAMEALRQSQDNLVRNEKLAAVGKLAASVGHELRNPLAAIRSAHAYLVRKVGEGDLVQRDPRVGQFFGVVDREMEACSRIISDLLDFARERKPDLRPCPLAPLVDDALSIVPQRPTVTIRNEVPASLPVPSLDKNQFRQVFVNLVQNAAEAIPEGRAGHVTVSATGGEGAPWRIRVSDDGTGIPPEQCAEIFQPLFTTKAKGTGLGLAVVAGMVERHGGRIWVESKVDEGTDFFIELPSVTRPASRDDAAPEQE